MKAGDYFIRESVPQRIANTKGKYSTQFMNGYTKHDRISRITNLEESARIGRNEAQFKKPAMSRNDMQQPMARYSEFWIG